MSLLDDMKEAVKTAKDQTDQVADQFNAQWDYINNEEYGHGKEMMKISRGLVIILLVVFWGLAFLAAMVADVLFTLIFTLVAVAWTYLIVRKARMDRLAKKEQEKEKELKKDRVGLSPVVATVLMIAITIVLAVILYIIAIGIYGIGGIGK